MYRLPLFIVLMMQVGWMTAQNPHGENLTIDCKECHNTDGWKIDYDQLQFDHSTTAFTLEGQHTQTSCIDCHKTLVFGDAETECITCHTDVHSMTVGNDCVRCHNAENWLVDNIPELHEQNGFPLTGPHDALSCLECHSSASDLRWDRIGNQCADCHINDYHSAQEPDHISAGFSTNCVECHDAFSSDWGTSGFHLFFPLEGGHDLANCSACHQGNDYTSASPECISCHQDDFNSTTAPDHQASGFNTRCTDCHTTNGWSPATFGDHDPRFPIFSGKHEGEWVSCQECHLNAGAGDYSTYSCIDCHEHDNANDLADEHDDVTNYVFQSTACFTCHPDGRK